MKYTVATGLRESDIPGLLGLCSTDPQLLSWYNVGAEILFNKGLYKDSYFRYIICADAACITWPRQIQTIEGYQVCRTPGQVRNQWFEFLGNSFGKPSKDSGWFGNLFDQGDLFCTYADVLPVAATGATAPAAQGSNYGFCGSGVTTLCTIKNLDTGLFNRLDAVGVDGSQTLQFAPGATCASDVTLSPIGSNYRFQGEGAAAVLCLKNLDTGLYNRIDSTAGPDYELGPGTAPAIISSVVPLAGANFRFLGSGASMVLELKNKDTGLWNRLDMSGADGAQTLVIGPDDNSSSSPSGSTGTKQIRLYPTIATDVGKTILLQGWDTFGNVILTNGGATEGERLVLPATGFVQTTWPAGWGSLVAVQKQRTAGYVRVFEKDSTVTDPLGLRDIALWAPDETAPQYRRSLIPGLQNVGDCGCHGSDTSATSASSCNKTQLTVIAKARFIPVVNDTDWLQIGSMAALEEIMLSVKRRRQGPAYFADSEAHEARATRLLEEELQNFQGHGNVVPFRVESSATFGAGVENLVGAYAPLSRY